MTRAKGGTAFGGKSWTPNPDHGMVPSTEQQLAELYDFPSVDLMRTWLLMTDVEILDAVDQDLLGLMDKRFVCDEFKELTPKMGRVARAGEVMLRGTNLGGQYVLEPWITPSMFMQFLGKGRDDGVGMDQFSFCESLGPEEGNAQLRRHWESWLTEDHIKQLAETGIDTVRIPVGDWQFLPYEPYVGCTDGANEHLLKVLDWCTQHQLSVLIDLHAVRNSQNGFDNSGQGQNVTWVDNEHFVHWDVRSASWIGNFHKDAQRYTTFDFDSFQHSLQAFSNMVDLLFDHPAVVAFQPVNEPWQYTPPNAYQLFVWTCYNMVQLKDINLGVIVHDSFRGSNLVFNKWMVGCQNVMIDDHIYTAWQGGEEDDYVDSACSQAHLLSSSVSQIPRVVGEWSLATDNCAMWLNGFNDNLPGYPTVECDWVPCPEPYMGREQPGTVLDPKLGPQPPFGTGFSSPDKGLCPVDKSWPHDDDMMKRLARAKLAAFELGNGWIFWNFRTELEPKWSYLESVKRGWIPNLRNTTEDADLIMQQWTGDVCKKSWIKSGYLTPAEPVPIWRSDIAKGVYLIGFVVATLVALALGFNALRNKKRRVEYVPVLDRHRILAGDERSSRHRSEPLFKVLGR